ncbi:MAG: thioredoxin family protein [Alphaproteobacteria bacterium]|nr:thioredoxin family protein [Alphaproteobacteria bacterium]MDE2265566.1 thioredoxin family protein [Alphaproteobacteria bacterium]
MKTILQIAVGLVVAVVITAGSAFASEQMAYSQTRFVRAQSAGDPVLVDIAASWCPVCKVQAGVVRQALRDPAFSHFIVLDVDFDSQKDVVRQFGANMQSTLIIYKGKNEVGRIIGATDPEIIKAMMRRATN